ncbi:hypothetical protein HZA57_07990, partial [Candidatus Poribacteria bacterium]|nr:hypothetical protein [Candidatus Poribacteria bacterium]
MNEDRLSGGAHGRLATLAGTILLVMLFCGTGCGQAEEEPAYAETLVVRSGTFEETIEETGSIEAARVVSITAPDRGKVIQIPETGTLVKQGEVVLVLDDSEAVTSLKDRLNDLKTVKSELEAAIESLKIAMRSNVLDVDAAESELAYNRVRLADVNQKLAETEILVEQSVVPEDDRREAHSRVTNTRLDTVTRDLDFRTEVTSKASAESQDRAQMDRQILRGDQARRDLDEA